MHIISPIVTSLRGKKRERKKKKKKEVNDRQDYDWIKEFSYQIFFQEISGNLKLSHSRLQKHEWWDPLASWEMFAQLHNHCFTFWIIQGKSSYTFILWFISIWLSGSFLFFLLVVFKFILSSSSSLINSIDSSALPQNNKRFRTTDDMNIQLVL